MAEINRQDSTVEIYRAGKAVEVLQLPAMVSGEDVLPRFILAIELCEVFKGTNLRRDSLPRMDFSFFLIE